MSHLHKDEKEPKRYVVTRDIKVPSGRILLDLRRGTVISDPSQLRTLHVAFEGHPPIREVVDTDLL